MVTPRDIAPQPWRAWWKRAPKPPRPIATRNICGACGAEVQYTSLDFTADGDVHFEPCGHNDVLKIEVIQ